MKWDRYPTSDRNAFGLAALNLCRALRTQPKIRSARFYWVTGNMVAIVVEGEPDCFDYNPEPDPEVGKAAFALADLAHQESIETWGDAGVGERNWQRAGRPSGAG
jgi:hypothetical protein